MHAGVERGERARRWDDRISRHVDRATSFVREREPRRRHQVEIAEPVLLHAPGVARVHGERVRDRKSTRLNSSHGYISYAVFCLKKKKKNKNIDNSEDRTTDGAS